MLLAGGRMYAAVIVTTVMIILIIIIILNNLLLMIGNHVSSDLVCLLVHRHQIAQTRTFLLKWRY